MTATALYPLTVLTRSIDALIRLEEATKRYKAKSTNKQPVDKLQANLARLFVKQGRHLTAALDPLQKYFVEDMSSEFDRIFDTATLETSSDMQETTTKAVSQVFLAAGKNLFNELNVKISFSLDNPRAAQYLASYGADFISGIDQTTKTDIKALLNAGIANGDSYAQVAQQIKQRYKQYAIGVPQQHIRSRAELISITELGNAYQAGNYAGVKSLTDAGLALQKRWLTLGDARVSDGCRANADAGWIGVDDLFPSGHLHPLRFPGCRCVTLYQRAPVAKPEELPVAAPKAPGEFTYSEDNVAAIDNTLASLFPNTKSHWSGVFRREDINALGLYYFQSHDIALSTKYEHLPDQMFRAVIHELLHTRSGEQRLYQGASVGWEEGIVDGNARRILARLAGEHDYTQVHPTNYWQQEYRNHPYTPYVDRLLMIATETGQDTDVFFEDMLGKTHLERVTYVKKLYRDKYTASAKQYGYYDATEKKDITRRVNEKMKLIDADMKRGT